jgi:DNA-binding NtrC family response regulator
MSLSKDTEIRPMAPLSYAVIAESAVMLEILTFVRRIAVSEAATILLDGENGTGKDLIARTLHDQSRRQAEPFIAVNCAAIPGTFKELKSQCERYCTDAQRIPRLSCVYPQRILASVAALSLLGSEGSEDG